MSGFRQRLRDGLLRLAGAVWLRPGTARRVLTGPLRGLRLEISVPVSHRLSLFFRVYEANVSEALARLVQPGMTVYIIGAHVGIHTLLAARLLRGQGQVIAFEGWPENYDGLCRNLALNPGLAVTALPLAVTRAPGTVTMARGSADGKHHLAAGGEGDTIQVEATSLDAFWAQNPACPALILMDIEGHELAALAGVEALLAACQPRLILEHHGQAAALESWLRARGYSAVHSDNRHTFA